MEKREVIGCYNRGKHYIETCLEQIASLEQNNDKELRQVLRGTAMVDVSYKAAENFVKVCGYVINGEDGSLKLKGKLYDLKEKVRQLYNSADKHNLITIKIICDSILKEIGEVEEWANDIESDGIQEMAQPEIIHETDNSECPNTGEDSEKKGESQPLTTEEIKEKLKKIDPFAQAEENEVIPYSVYYQRLTNWKTKQGDGKFKVVHVIDGDKCDLPLFESCVSRADISDVVIEGNKMLARLFMFYVAAKFKDSGSYKKAAAKTFGLSENTRLSGVSSNYRADFYNIMRDLFPESKPQ